MLLKIMKTWLLSFFGMTDVLFSLNTENWSLINNLALCIFKLFWFGTFIDFQIFWPFWIEELTEILILIFLRSFLIINLLTLINNLATVFKEDLFALRRSFHRWITCRKNYNKAKLLRFISFKIWYILLNYLNFDISSLFRSNRPQKIVKEFQEFLVQANFYELIQLYFLMIA